MKRVALLLLCACAEAGQEPVLDAGSPEEPIDGGVLSKDASLVDAAPSEDPDAGFLPDAVPRCVPVEDDSSALSFDGVDDHVTMGAAPQLGLETFTLEAWVRRDGPGRTAGTGVGGLQLVPIAGKGRGENDGTNVDCNYAFGFWGDVLGADFEDAASGANHPVWGTTAIPIGEWHHVAVTYDGARWQLFVDGRLDGEAIANATPRFDSIQHFGIGTAFNSQGVAAGRLHGAVDEVRLWNRARSEEEIAGSMFEAITAGEGLVARWAIDASEGDTVIDSVGDADGMIVGATYTSTGALLDRGVPPEITPITPADMVATRTVTLEVAIEDPDSDGFEVTFFARPITEADDFTIVVLPDTQYYTVDGNDLEQYFYDQTQWIVDNVDTYNIVAVIHNGDIVDRANQEYQWTIADRAMRTIEAPLARFPDGVPWGPSVGNHDENPNSSPTGTTEFNRWFGVARFEGRAYYGGHYGSNNDENWFTFSAGGLDFVVVNLKYNTDPDPAVLNWARQVFLMHPDSFGILNSHYILTSAGNFGAQGRRIYDALKDVPNLHLMTCGHVGAERRRSDTFEGHTIHTMLADYQFRANGGGGVLRIWEFSPANDELTVRSYSPSTDTFETDDDSEFTLSVDLSRAAGEPFREIGRIELLGSRTATATIELAGLQAGLQYEWYAEVNDCAHTSKSSVQRVRSQ